MRKVGKLSIRLCLLLTMLLFLIMSAACSSEQTNSGNTPPEPKPPEKSEPPQKEEKQDPVELTVLTPGGGTLEWFMERYGNPIQEKYPHYSFEVIENTNNALLNLVTAGEKLDLIITSFVGFRNSVKPLGLLADMSDLVSKYQFDLSRMDDAYHNMMRNLDDGNLSGLPLYDLSLVLYYNQDIFDKFAVDYPEDGMTWEELYETAKNLTREDEGTQYRGFVTAPGNLVTVNQYSLGFLDSKGEKSALNTDAWKNYIETFLPLYSMPGYEPTVAIIGGSGAVKDAFFKEKTAAMFVMFNSDAPKPEDGISWDAVSLPEFEDLPGVGSQPYPVYVAIASTSEQRDAAFLAIEQLLTDEVQTQLTAEYAQITPLTNPDVKAAFGRNVEQWQGKNIAAITSKVPASPLDYVGEYNSFGQGIITERNDVSDYRRERCEHGAAGSG